MKVEYDEMLHKWVVWKISGSVLEEVYSSKEKKDCLAYIKKNKKKGKSKDVEL